jgi:hypothetical protein
MALLARGATLDPAPLPQGRLRRGRTVAGRRHAAARRRRLALSAAGAAVAARSGVRAGLPRVRAWGESAPGEPFFDIAGGEAPAGYQFELPGDAFEYPPVEIDGLAVRVISPLTLYQLRPGIASQGSVGPLSERHLAALTQLRERFFPDRTEGELLPVVEPLS